MEGIREVQTLPLQVTRACRGDSRILRPQSRVYSSSLEQLPSTSTSTSLKLPWLPLINRDTHRVSTSNREKANPLAESRGGSNSSGSAEGVKGQTELSRQFRRDPSALCLNPNLHALWATLTWSTVTWQRFLLSQCICLWTGHRGIAWGRKS